MLPGIFFWRYGVVYVATNLINGKQYVGQTIHEVDERANGHFKEAKRRRKNTILANAILKYGKQAFEFREVFVAFNRAGLNAGEIALIADLNTIHPGGYNLKLGGAGGPHHPETLARIAAKNRGRKFTAEQRANVSQALINSPAHKAHIESLRGKKHSIEHKQKISRALKGMPKTPEHIAAAAQAVREKGWSEERRLAQIALNKSSEHIQKCAAGNRGRKRSEAARKNMSESRKAYFSNPENRKQLSLANKGKPWSEARRAAQVSKQAAAQPN